MRVCAPAPPARDARERPTQKHVRHKSEQQRDDERLDRVELLQLDNLVDRVHRETEKDYPGGHIPSIGNDIVPRLADPAER
jgi:hypothetical protein